jgi:O-antigen/teichoic acid export membrane protein
MTEGAEFLPATGAKLPPSLTGGRLLARNTIWNLLGQLLPMIVAVVAIPPLIRGLGVPRFGVLSLAWIVIGYFSLFDMGIGRALTKLVAEKIGAGEDHEIPALAWTALALMVLLGTLAGIATFALSPWLIHRVLKIPLDLQTETLHGFYLLAVSIPLVTLTSGWRGILEAQQHFRVLNLIRIPMSVFSLGGPLLVLPFSHSLVPVVGVLVAGRFVGYVAHQVTCFHFAPALRRGIAVRTSLVVPLLRIGGWMTVSNLLGPAILYVDRFLIGAALSLGAVAYYTAPFDMVSRLTVIPTAIAGVLFPAFALSIARDPNRTGLLLNRGIKYTFLTMFPLTLVIVSLAPEILRLWLGAAFAEHSGPVLRWLAVGILMNAVTVVPFALLQGIGRPDITGKLLLADLAIYSGVVWLLIARFNIEGAAIAWAGRAIMEAVVFLGFGYHFLPRRSLPLKQIGVGTIAAAFGLYASTLPHGLGVKVGFLGSELLLFALVIWFWTLAPEERAFFSFRRRDLAAVESAAPVSVTGGNATI